MSTDIDRLENQIMTMISANNDLIRECEIDKNKNSSITLEMKKKNFKYTFK